MADVLFIHPTNHIHPRVIPVGSIAAANAISTPALGRYASEVTAEEIEEARVILLDVHWFLPMGVLEGLVGAIRRVNPRARIVIGGLAASFYGPHFRARFAVDYVVGGHAETALPELVDRLLAGEPPGALPRVWQEDHEAGPLQRPSQEAFDALDWITLDWFPTYATYARELHERITFDPATPQMDAWPLLPVTRGCVRDCGFCYGAYQDRVFGGGVRARSASTLVTDLRRLEADAHVNFVSLLFADAVYLRSYLDHLENLQVNLDAYLYFCGSLSSEELGRATSAFSGGVGFSIIQPADLAPLRRGPSPAAQEADFAAMLDHIEGLSGSGAVVLFVDEASPALERAHARGGNVVKATGEDWPVIRPDEAALEGEDALEVQLAEVIDHARRTSHLHLFRSLVPAIAAAFKMNDVFRYEPGALADRELEALPRRVAHLYMHSIFEERRYAVGEVTLAWTLSDLPPRAGVDWGAPGPGPGEPVAWRQGLNGPVWEGALSVPDGGPWGVGVVPTMEVSGEEPIALRGWDAARVPTLTVPPGPGRVVRLGGGVDEQGVRLWIEDGDQRRSWLLEPPRPEPSAGGAGPVAALVGSLPEHPTWPSRETAERIADDLRAAGWALEGTETTPAHLAALATPPGGSRPMALALFRARVDEPYLHRGAVALAYGDLPPEISAERLAAQIFEAVEDLP